MFVGSHLRHVEIVAVDTQVSLVPQRPDVEPLSDLLQRNMGHGQVGGLFVFRVPQQQVDRISVRTFDHAAEFASVGVESPAE